MSPHTAYLHSRCPTCPLDTSQDGVCGCTAFWSRALRPGSEPIPEPSDNCSTTRPGSPHETCFFWYHGTCRRGLQCQLAHESHITWPIPVPPGFVHYEVCMLVLCPLRSDLVALGQEKEKERGKEQPAGQDDGSGTMLRGEEDHGVEPGTLFEPNSRALDGSYSDSESEEEGELVETHHTAFAPRKTPAGKPSFDNSSTATIPPPHPRSANKPHPLASSRHPDTMSKRKRRPSTTPTTSTKRTKPAPSTPRRSSSAPNPPFTAPTGPRASSTIPTGPRNPSAPARPRKRVPPARNARKICFAWYHSQPCAQRRKNKCPFSHYLAGAGGEVNRPRNVGGHKGCVLPLCPLRAGTRDGITEQEIVEMRRRAKEDGRERMEKTRAEKRSKEGRLDYGDEMLVEGDGGEKTSAKGVWVDMPIRQKVRQSGVLVDYELPVGAARLDWDTDLVRRIFGEIA